jgi:D-alanyl-D-alanine carboxypeptidase
MKLALVVLAACSGSTVPPPPPPPPSPSPSVVKPPDDLTSAIESVRAAENLPAAGIAIWKHGVLVARGVSGMRALGDKTPVTFDDQWHLGSDTKAMTATLIGIYVDKGVLHWTDTLATLFAGEKIDPGYANVTLDQLLQHRGGFPSASGPTWMKHGYDPEGRIEYVRDVLAQPPAQPIGTYEYSNTGYIVAGAALERATKQPWEQLIARDLFTPLHMTSCGFGAPGSETVVDQPRGHRADGTPMVGLGGDNPPIIGPAGSVHCSLADWGKFLAIHAAAKQTLVTPATMEHLHTEPKGVPGLTYMAGWIVLNAGRGDTRYAHEGSNTMWRAIALVVPAVDVVVAIVANKDDDGLFKAAVPLVTPYLKPE